jgi:ferredoxin
VRVVVSERCAGHGRCFSNAPGLFEDDEDGFSVPKNDGAVPVGLEDDAQAAAGGCPESAITILE